MRINPAPAPPRRTFARVMNFDLGLPELRRRRCRPIGVWSALVEGHEVLRLGEHRSTTDRRRDVLPKSSGDGTTIDFHPVADTSQKSKDCNEFSHTMHVKHQSVSLDSPCAPTVRVPLWETWDQARD